MYWIFWPIKTMIYLFIHLNFFSFVSAMFCIFQCRFLTSFFPRFILKYFIFLDLWRLYISSCLLLVIKIHVIVIIDLKSCNLAKHTCLGLIAFPYILSNFLHRQSCHLWKGQVKFFFSNLNALYCFSLTDYTG